MHLSDEILLWYRGDLGWNTDGSTRSRQGQWPDKSDPDAEGIFTLAEVPQLAANHGLQVLGIANHPTDPAKPWQLAADDPISRLLLEEAVEVADINRAGSAPILLLAGVDAAVIFVNGEPVLEVSGSVLDGLDFVLISRKHITGEKDIGMIRDSLLFAVNHSFASILVHPDRYIRDIEAELHDVWVRVLGAMAHHRVAFEINARYWPSPTLLKMALDAGVMFALSVDFKKPSQFRPHRERTPEEVALDAALKRWANQRTQPGDDEIIAAHKTEALHGRAAYEAKLAELIVYIEGVGITPDRVINSSSLRLVDHLIVGQDRFGFGPVSNLRFVRSQLGL